MKTTISAYTQDKIRCWYYSTDTSDLDLGIGYVHSLVSDARNTRAEAGDVALVIARKGTRFYAHVSQITEAQLSYSKLINELVFGRNGGYNPTSRTVVHQVRHLTKVHDITDWVGATGAEFDQTGIKMALRENLMYELIFLG